MRGRVSGFQFGLEGEQYISFRLTEDGRREYEELKDKPDLVIEAKPYRKRRSLDANAFCWRICSRIADAQGITKEEVYRRNIREGGVYEEWDMLDELIPSFQRLWATQGIGWFVDIVDSSGPGRTLCFAYRGSSEYDTKQMSALIDRLLQDATGEGVEITSPSLTALLNDWEAKHEKRTTRKR